MTSIRQILIDLTIMVATVTLIIFLYQTYAGNVVLFLFGEQRQTIFLDDVSIQVSYAETDAELQKGLAGVKSLRDRDGKLFFFDQEGYYKMWMKDTLIPLDIIWINNDLTVVHIEKNVQPDSYPATYSSPQPARFVLEMNAFFSDEYNIHKGTKVTIPAADLPDDIKATLR